MGAPTDRAAAGLPTTVLAARSRVLRIASIRKRPGTLALHGLPLFGSVDEDKAPLVAEKQVPSLREEAYARQRHGPSALFGNLGMPPPAHPGGEEVQQQTR